MYSRLGNIPVKVTYRYNWIAKCAKKVLGRRFSAPFRRRVKMIVEAQVPKKHPKYFKLIKYPYSEGEADGST